MTEPPRDSSLASLHPAFRVKVEALLASLERAGVPFAPHETLRPAERQAWLYASGRTRPGAIVTQKDGGLGVWPVTHPVVSERLKTRRSRHQSGLACDLYPIHADGRIYIPTADHEEWALLAATARGLGLRAGRDWGDSPHVEFRGPLPKETK